MKMNETQKKFSFIIHITCSLFFVATLRIICIKYTLKDIIMADQIK